MFFSQGVPRNPHAKSKRSYDLDLVPVAVLILQIRQEVATILHFTHIQGSRRIRISVSFTACPPPKAPDVRSHGTVPGKLRQASIDVRQDWHRAERTVVPWNHVHFVLQLSVSLNRNPRPDPGEEVGRSVAAFSSRSDASLSVLKAEQIKNNR